MDGMDSALPVKQPSNPADVALPLHDVAMAAPHRPRRRMRALHAVLEGAAVLVAYAACTVFVMRPLFRHPGLAVVDPLNKGGSGPLGLPDVNMVIWLLAWNCHALLHAPQHLFDGNMFHPAHDV